MKEKYLVAVADLDSHRICIARVCDTLAEANAYADGFNAAAEECDSCSFADVIHNI